MIKLPLQAATHSSPSCKRRTMSERYQKVFSRAENLYSDNAPVIIRAYTLLKDTQTGRMSAQLKLQNISKKTISSVKVQITPYNAIKIPLEHPIEFEYSNLSIGAKEEFGTNQPIPLPNAATRSFAICVLAVGFANGSNWTCTSAADWTDAWDKGNVYWADQWEYADGVPTAKK